MAKLAIVFPGQGSQAVGMLADIAAQEITVARTFDEASQALGYNLWELVQGGPAEKLNRTEFTQPALLTSSIALWRLWQEKSGRQPDIVAGHSLGEYSALVCARVLGFADAVDLVRKRGQYMQSAVPVGVGSMAAILGLGDEQVVELCNQSSVDQVVQAVNFNSPGQVVIAGHTAAVERTIEACQQAGARRAMLLAVSAPFHSQLMQPAAEKMSEALDRMELTEPVFEVVQNVHAKPEADPDKIRENLVLQMDHAVLWTDTVEYLVSQGVDTVIECGPGKVLSGLNRRIAKSVDSKVISDPESLDSTLAAV
ncbi:MAG: ACP S-malonyltransferase [Pseudomonadales bacterium]|jgi:[acyl-carrier-protein] S-malonyltransferase|nr:ACP S-malonyltransferase [Pseudomonadales bacterium]MDP7144773.1 ACP S-malonyltransferase [Pseudomonadales bacterium]MDP7358477.1 ACP S-malonyltransferase [Pseudomonadales bacterium]MDP7594920.1 ACP S-malonyltransferase [Pseudomonadales bacterium]HJN50016.1 ACP S-malonyltransferase [Pseudomonadales bacterium]|tara:strand:+ start:101 stop:1033 length:933 start_codon:yes stop_codon:yes gene_type:complete